IFQYLLYPISPLPISFFFFSSRRRHPTFSRDWSSDVCSSDLLFRKWATGILKDYAIKGYAENKKKLANLNKIIHISQRTTSYLRSEERRVGKEFIYLGTRKG